MARRRLGISINIIVLVAILAAANAFLGFSAARESERAMTEQIQARMMDLACSAADLLDGDSLAAITAEDEGTPAYRKVMDTLGVFRDNMAVTYIYCVRQIGDKSFAIIVDPTIENPASFGEPVTYTEALGKAGRGTAAVDDTPYEDQWGRFYSAYCPVFDSKGNVASVVGVDFDATWYEERAASINRMAITSCIASLVLALIAIALVARMSRAEARHGESLQRANSYDPLTGLANMGRFLELAQTARDEVLAQGEEPAMLYMDLADMRAFNQKRGFAEGDKLLQAFAKLLAGHFGHERCSRFGQDHFVVSTSGTDLDERLDAFIGECAGINEGKSLPVHIGIYPSSLGIVGVGLACDRAKVASDEIHGARQSGYRYYSVEMMERVERRQHIIDNVDRAIAEGWIKVYYQPIVRASTGKVCDEEALARWDDPELGMLMPTEFVPVLEDERLAYKLDLNVLEQTLEKMKGMAQAGLYVVPASINLSRSDFETCDLVEEACKRVDAAGIDRAKINFEVTETTIGRDIDFMGQQIDRLHELGFQVWMDDFGSEYSSLEYLQSLHFDVLKFDMRFMQQFDNSDKSKIMLTELIRMAAGLGIDTVVEGVETQEQMEFLRAVGCGKLQGFFFSPPNSFEQVLQRYENGTAIGFENPEESDYYAALSGVNMYDLSSIARGDEEGLQQYFDTLPMAIVETMEDEFAIMRCNTSYLDFIDRVVGNGDVAMRIPFTLAEQTGQSEFLRRIRRCGEQGGRFTVDEKMPNGFTVHAFVRRIAVNPVNGAAAVAVAVLAITKD